MMSKKDIKRIAIVIALVLSVFVSFFKENQEIIPVRNIDAAFVERVVDGDTLVLLYNGTTTKVRLIGIDTPESVDPRKPVECYGKESKEYVSQMLTRTSVFVETDESQGLYDRYGRMLAYIYQGTSTVSVNQDLIQKGYAREYTYDKAYRYIKEFKLSELEARQKNLGVWNSKVCSN